MSINQRVIKLFVVLIFSTTFIFSSSYYGAKAFGDTENVSGNFWSGTSIGYLDISGKNKSEAASRLEEKYVEWLKDTKINLQYQEKTVSFDSDLFHLDSQQTVNSIKDGQKNTAFITIEKSQVANQIQMLFPQLKSSDFDINKLTASLAETASKFEKGTYTLDLYNDFLFIDQKKKDAVLSSVTVPLNGVPEDLQGFIDEHPKIDIPGQASFSLLGFVNEKKVNVQPETLNMIATGIYQAILPSNFTIVERNIGNTLPDYVRLGLEAKVNQLKKADLIFTNPNKEKCYLEFNLENDQLKVILKGGQLLYTYKISEKDAQKLAPKTIVQYSPLVLPGKIIIQNPGGDGQIVKVYRDVYQGEQYMKSELISEDYYPPAYRIEIHSLTGSTTTRTQPASTASTTSGTQQTNTGTTSQQTTSPSATGDVQPVSNETDLWGQPNEQPK